MKTISRHAHSFSILSRIDPHAAQATRTETQNPKFFQYPLADRPSCSLADDTILHVFFTTFSILSRIDPHAAYASVAIRYYRSLSLSVSSRGSTLMQQRGSL